MIEIVVVVEADADAKIVCALTDRIFIEEGPSWIDGHLLPAIRNWSGLEEGSAFTKWTSIDDLARDQIRSLSGGPSSTIHVTRLTRRAGSEKNSRPFDSR